MATTQETRQSEKTITEPDQQVSHPFSDPTPYTDLILLVEEQRLYVNKIVLSLASPVFKTMFEADFKEKPSKEIFFPDKTFDDMQEFLLCIYPSTLKPVTRENIDAVLPLAHEYQVKQLIDRCEEFVLNRFQMAKEELKNPPLKELVHFLFFADKYNLERLLEVCSEKMIARKYTSYPYNYGYKDFAEKEEEFKMVSCKIKMEILLKRMQLLEPLAYDLAKGQGTYANLTKACFAFDN